MDVKFRKLISRLSIKERMRPEKTMSGCGSSDSQINRHQHQQDTTNNLVPTTIFEEDVNNDNSNNNNNGNRIVLIPHPINYWPESNILTQLQFPCPTLLRKNKCSSIMMESQESLYEEIKPRTMTPPIPEIIITTTTTTTTEQVSKSSPEGQDEDDDDDGVGDGSSVEEVQVEEDDNSNIYINLKELEQERRSLIAAQCVRAKYAENWIDDQVVEDSIVGNNKAKTKSYWEAQMRKDQREKNRTQNKYWNNNAPSSDIIIQKMNAEIEELHRREKELKKKKGEVEDDEEVFSSNTSSVDEFENSDSPRLESGFYSNAGEDESIPSPELLNSINENNSFIESPAEVELENTTFSPETQRSEELNTVETFAFLNESNGGRTEPESPPPTFTFQKETPIEREIRLGRERDNEHKELRRISSSTSNLSFSANEFVSLPVSHAVTKDVKQPKPAIRSFSTSAATAVVNGEEKTVTSNTKPDASRDIQYRMATERLKKEMEEAKLREEELKSREGNQDTTSSTPKSYTPVYVVPVKAVANRFEVVEKGKPKLSTSISEETTVHLPERKNLTKEASIDVHGISPVVNNDTPKESKSMSEVVYTPISRPKFNSIERYLLKSSSKLRIGKNFQIPIAVSVAEPEPTVMEEKTEEDEEPVTPRKRLVRAQDKIDQELKEMREREKEFSLRRNFKSTPDLTEKNHDDKEVNENNTIVVLREGRKEVNENNTSVVLREGRKEVSIEIKERRRSALINQWEEKIQGGN